MTSFLMGKNPANSNNISAATNTAPQKSNNGSGFDSVIKKQSSWGCSLDSMEESSKTNVKGGNDKKCSRRQSFSTVQIREYDVIIGDHPACKEGLSLSIGWNYLLERSQTLDDYEASRSEKGRRPMEELILTAKERWVRLSTNGNYSEKQLFIEHRKILMKERSDFFTAGKKGKELKGDETR